MPIATNSGVKIYWDEAGEGEPVLLIMGLGSSRATWNRIRPALASQYRTIAFDNRGVGESDVPAGPYSMREMSADAVAVLDAANIASAHVLGLSMGGMIAQELALQYPDRVRSLILACTSPGGKNAVQADQEALNVIGSLTSMRPEVGTEALVPILHAAGTARTRIDEDLALRRKWYPSAEVIGDSYWRSVAGKHSAACIRSVCLRSSFMAIAIALFRRAMERYLHSVFRVQDLCWCHRLVMCSLRINHSKAKRKSSDS